MGKEKQTILLRILAITLLLPFSAMAQSAPSGPMTLPTRDTHQNVSIVADPYISASRYGEQFGKKSLYDAGIIAINVYFRNDNDAPIRLNLGTIDLTISLPGVARQQLDPLSPAEVADRTLLTADASPHLPRWPISFPGSVSGKSKAWNKMAAALQTVVLSTDILPPHATTHGFLFFDLNHDFDAIRHAHLYIPDLSFMTNHKALFFFDIDLAAAQDK
ncbi:MAG TPA: hypothetical protein VNI36_10575 [Candidatus Dormibacteraeota bacterium]|nr:hypothetical protein [Candidatus Dormibacteraeota bacterium]